MARRYVFNVFTGTLDIIDVPDAAGDVRVVDCVCSGTDAVGDLVYHTGLAPSDTPEVSRVQIDTQGQDRVFGLILEKPTLNTCKVLIEGELSGVGFSPGSTYYANTAAQLTPTRPLRRSGGTRSVHIIGTALTATTLFFRPAENVARLSEA